MKVPADFIVEETPHAIVVVRKDLSNELLPLLSMPVVPDDERFVNAHWYTGRGPTPSVPLGATQRAVLRTYRHGGLLRGLTRDVFASFLPRPIRELILSHRARSRGIPTPAVLGAAVFPIVGPLYRGMIAVEELPDGADGLEVLQRVSELSTLARKRILIPILSAAGRSLAQAHTGGLVHSDLNVKNLYATADPLHVFLLDLDRCRLEPSMLEPWQRREQLERLRRSLIKVTNSHQLAPLTTREIGALVSSYAKEAQLLDSALKTIVGGLC